jgi:hypothetical protein
MSTANQEEFINRIRLALGKPFAESRQKADLISGEMPVETCTILERIKNRTAEDRKKLLETLIEAARPIHLTVRTCGNISAVTGAIAEVIRNKDPEWGDKKRVVAWQHPLIESLNLPDALSEQEVPVFFSDVNAPERETISESLRLISAWRIRPPW